MGCLWQIYISKGSTPTWSFRSINIYILWDHNDLQTVGNFLSSLSLSLSRLRKYLSTREEKLFGENIGGFSLEIQLNFEMAAPRLKWLCDSLNKKLKQLWFWSIECRHFSWHKCWQKVALCHILRGSEDIKILLTTNFHLVFAIPDKTITL